MSPISPITVEPELPEEPEDVLVAALTDTLVAAVKHTTTKF